ncbi:MAG: hypothetical protein OEM84_05185 [Acidimicrobiia bacterium]|nr:hypothetical protein [Acidimicrobiia bacterium]
MKRLFKFGLFAALAAGAVKLVSTQKADWQGLTEPEIRTKLHNKLDAKVPSDKVDQMADKIIDGMRKRGALGEEGPSEA